MNPLNIHYSSQLIRDCSNESDRLAGATPSKSSNSGHAKVLKEAIQKGVQQTPLTVDDLSRWHSLIVQERTDRGCQIHEVAMNLYKANADDLAEANKLVDLINERTKLENYPTSDVERVNLIAKIFQDFEKMPQFNDAHHSLGRILVNYMNSRLFTPIFIFKLSEKEQLEKAATDLNVARLFFASKVKEMAFDSFYHLLDLNSHSGDSYSYVDSEGHGTTIEYHALAKAEKTWQAQS